MKNRIKLTIIVTHFDTYELTRKLMRELVTQKEEEVEIILVDDGEVEERLDEFKGEGVEVIHLGEDKGVSYTRNVGIKRARGKYIGFIDGDDMITMDYIERLIDLIGKREEDIIYFNWADFNSNTITRHPTNYAVWKAIYRKEFIPLFREEYRKEEDVPFQEEIREKEHTEYYYDRVLYIYNSNRVGSLYWKTIHKVEV